MRFDRMLRRLRVLLRKNRIEREMDEEMRFHLEMEIEELVRVKRLSSKEARRRALIAFGGVERYKEWAREARGVSGIENSLRDARQSVRRLLREPGFSVPTIANIALGLGVAIAVFALVNGVLLRPLPYPEPDRLVTLSHSATNAGFPVNGQSLGTYLHYREENRVFEDIGVYLERDRALTDGEGVPKQVRVADVSPSLLSIVGDVPSEALREGPSQVLYFPNLHPPLADTITGVVHIYVPSDEMYVVRTNLPAASVLPAIRNAIDRVDPKLVMTHTGTLERLVADSRARARLIMLLLMVGAATALVLGILGVYGILSYTVARRRPELGLRMALGADPKMLIRMVVRRGATLAIAGIAIGIPAALTLGQFLDALLYEVSPNDPSAIIAMSVLLFLVALAASYVPARRASAIDPSEALRAD